MISVFDTQPVILEEKDGHVQRQQWGSFKRCGL